MIPGILNCFQLASQDGLGYPLTRPIKTGWRGDLHSILFPLVVCVMEKPSLQTSHLLP